METVTVELRQKAGGICVYPVCGRAQAFAAIAGHKALTLETLHWIKELGFAVVMSEAGAEAREVGHPDRNVVALPPPVTRVPALNPRRGVLAGVFGR